jgi:hypothetical protein
MALVELSAAAFILLNAGKLAGYVPQFLKIYRDRNGAAAVSLGTWLIFSASNAATVAYALANSGDWIIATVFGLNAMSCLLIASLTWIRRQAQRFRPAAAPASAARPPPANLSQQDVTRLTPGASDRPQAPPRQ